MRLVYLPLTLLLAACASGPLPKLKPATAYNPADYEWSKASGPNSIVGTVWTILPNGRRKGCEGQVIVRPAGGHFDDRMRLRYGSTERGHLRTEGRNHGPGVEFDYRVQDVWRKIPCNGQGGFEAHGLPDGAYYVTSVISWPRPYWIKDMGGDADFFMQRVEVAGGEVARVELHPQL